MKKIVSLMVIMMLVFTFVACEKDEVEKESFQPITFVDGMGREVTIDASIEKVVSLAPSMTEMLYAFDLGDLLVGRTSYCDFPEAALSVESVGSLREPNIEAIIGLEPDLILMSTHGDEETMKMFEEAGMTVAVLIAQESFEGVYEIMDQFGMIFNEKEKAETLKADMKSEVATLVEAVEDVERQTVYYVVGYGDSDWTATGDTFIHQVLEMAGGINIAADATGWGYNLETLIEKDPHFIVLDELYDTKATFTSTEGYEDLTAVKEGRVYEIDTNLLSRQGPRIVEGLRALIEIMHPEALK